MVQPNAKPSTWSTDPNINTKTKRKSESTHKSPTTPSTSTLKQSPIKSPAKPKTQVTLKSIQEHSKVTQSHDKPRINPTGTTREIKKEKLDETKKTPNSSKETVVLSSPEEDDLYSNEIFHDTPSESQSQPAPNKIDLTNDNTKQAITETNPSASFTTHRNQAQGRGGRGGRTLVSQGRGGRGGERILPPPRTKSSKPDANVKTPVNLNENFDRESDNSKSIKQSEQTRSHGELQLNQPTQITQPTGDPSVKATNTVTSASASHDTSSNSESTDPASITSAHSETTTANSTSTPKPSSLKTGKYNVTTGSTFPESQQIVSRTPLYA